MKRYVIVCIQQHGRRFECNRQACLGHVRIHQLLEPSLVQDLIVLRHDVLEDQLGCMKGIGAILLELLERQRLLRVRGRLNVSLLGPHIN